MRMTSCCAWRTSSGRGERRNDVICVATEAGHCTLTSYEHQRLSAFIFEAALILLVSQGFTGFSGILQKVAGQDRRAVVPKGLNSIALRQQ